MATIEEVDNALRAYYKALNKEDQYTQDDGRGLIEYYCDENGIDEEGLKDEMTTTEDPEDSVLIDIDDDFPIPKNEQIDNDEKKRQHYIFNILKQCYEDPDKSWAYLTSGLPSFNKQLFEGIQTKDIEQCKKTYLNQCPSIYYQGLNIDISLLQILSIGKEHKFDYLQHLVDLYDRDRIRVILKEKSAKIWPIEDWVKKGNNPHLKTLERLRVPRLAKPKKGEAKTVLASTLASSAIKSFGHRICSKLLFNPMKKIDDSMETVLIYVTAALSQILHIIAPSNKSLVKKKRTLPFSMDLVIAVDKPIEIKNKEDEEDVSDDEDDLPNDEEEKGPYQDYVGCIERKLKQNKLKHSKFDIDSNDASATKEAQRGFVDIYKEFEQKVEEKEQKDAYPYRKRFITMVDRREDKKPDKDNKGDNNLDMVYIFEPPKGFARDIPDDEVPEWYVSASRTCLLPNMEYKQDEAIGKPNPARLQEEPKKEVKDDEDKNIGAAFHCKGGLLSFSFHVKAADQIKCYLFWNGQMIRFFPDEAEYILPEIFNMEREDNKTFVKSKDWDELLKYIKEKLIDLKFDAFRNMSK